MSQSFTLSAPVNVIGVPTSILAMRPPTGKDLRTHGMPVRQDGGGSEIDGEKMSAMIAGLCNVPMSTIDELVASDWMTLSLAVMRFLAPSAPDSSTDISSAAGGGATSIMSSV